MKSKLKLALFIIAFILNGLNGICAGAAFANKKTFLIKKRTAEPGFIVLNSGDTLKGYIEYKQWGRNPRSIRFGASADLRNAKTYQIAELQAFEVTGFDDYCRAVIEKDARRLSQDNELSAHLNTFVTDTVWLRSLVKGNAISLYELIQDRPHYVIKKNGKYEELIYKKGKENDNYYDFHVYRTRLNEIADSMGLSQDLKEKINRSGYVADDLTVILKLMNGITNEPQVKNKATTTTTKSNFILSAALSGSRISVTGDTEEFYNMQFDRAAVPKITAGVVFYGSRGLQDFSLNIGLGYSRAKYSGIGTKYSDVPKASYAIEQNNVSLNIGIGYDFVSSTKWKANIGGNIGYVRSNYSKNEFQRFDYDKPFLNYLTLTKGYMEFNVTGGLRYGQHWGLILSAGQSMGYYEGAVIDLEISDISGGLSYRF